MIIFLDTEFSSLIKAECEILSIGMVSEDGQHSLYVERNDYRRDACSDFVVKSVLPLFGRIPESQCSLQELNIRVLNFLRAVGTYPTMACDSSYDSCLLYVAMRNAEMTEGPGPLLSQSINLNDYTSHPAFEKAFNAHFCDGRDLHHALWDAQALRAGYLAYMNFQKLMRLREDVE